MGMRSCQMWLMPLRRQQRRYTSQIGCKCYALKYAACLLAPYTHTHTHAHIYTCTHTHTYYTGWVRTSILRELMVNGSSLRICCWGKLKWVEILFHLYTYREVWLMDANVYHTYVVARNYALTIQLCIYYRCIKLQRICKSNHNGGTVYWSAW